MSKKIKSSKNKLVSPRSAKYEGYNNSKRVPEITKKVIGVKASQ